MLGVFSPQGPIALGERNLIIVATLIMLLVAIPLLFTLYTIAWKYRAGNKKKLYEPDRVGNIPRQLVWWIIPAIIVFILALINWRSTHTLEPTRSLDSNVPPLTIQVIALPWKWLFLYPSQGIATVNFVEFPEKTPVHFLLTADAPMSSFWIPQLGSQIYAMAAMQTQLNLMADTAGEYAGRDTEINGAGYSGMTFVAQSVSQDDFSAWVASVQQSSSSLTLDGYKVLSVPSENNPQVYFASYDKNLYDSILMKYMASSTMTSPNMNMSHM